MTRRLWLLALLVGPGCNEFDLSPKAPEPVQADPEPTEPEPEPEPDQGVPEIAVFPDLVDFGVLPRDCASEDKLIRVRNVGDADLDITAIDIAGPDGDVFDLVDAGAIVLAPDEVLSFHVGFEPPAASLFDRARIEIESNDPDTPRANVDLLGEGDDDDSVEEVFTQGTISAVDVLWVIDNSGSMSGEVAALSSEFGVFIQNFINLGLDWQIAVVTTDMADPSQSGRFRGPIISPTTPNPVAAFTNQANAGFNGSADEKGFAASQAALTAPLINSAAHSGFIRTGANLAVVVVSDEDDVSGNNPGVTSYSNWLESLKPDPTMTTFSAVAGPDGTFTLLPACNTFATGASASTAPRYADAVRRTGGIHANICNMAFDQVLTFLSFVAAGMQVEFDLQYAPSSVGLIEVEVDGQPVGFGAFNGWSWDAATQRIRFNGSSIPGPGEEIVIRYPISGGCP